MAVAAFWIALAAVLIAGSWRKKAVEQMRHETVRLLIQQGRELTEEEVRNLINPPHPPLPEGHPWMRRQDPWRAYRLCRMSGTILMFVAVGVAAAISGIGVAQAAPQATVAGIGVGLLVFLLGAAFYFAARFLQPSENRAQADDRDS